MLIGLNSSDFTYGWNGYINGLTLFYSHYTDTVQEEIHSIPITPGCFYFIFGTVVKLFCRIDPDCISSKYSKDLSWRTLHPVH